MAAYNELLIWQKSMDVCREVYQLTNTFPHHERFGLTSQMRRASISIPSNIAEGSRRGSQKDFRKFLYIAYGSGAELETQLILAKDFGYLSKNTKQRIEELLSETMRMLNSFINNITL